MEPKVERRCEILIGSAMVVLTFALGYFLLVDEFVANFMLVVAGLCLGWIAFLYCMGNALPGN